MYCKHYNKIYCNEHWTGEQPFISISHGHKFNQITQAVKTLSLSFPFWTRFYSISLPIFVLCGSTLILDRNVDFDNHSLAVTMKTTWHIKRCESLYLRWIYFDWIRQSIHFFWFSSISSSQRHPLDIDLSSLANLVCHRFHCVAVSRSHTHIRSV